jgi:hypothetical protein
MQPPTRKHRGEHGHVWKTKAELLLIVAEAGGRCSPGHVREQAVALDLVSKTRSSAIATQRKWLIEHGYLTILSEPKKGRSLWALPDGYSDTERIYEKVEKYLPEKLDRFLQSPYIGAIYVRDASDELARHQSAGPARRTNIPRIAEGFRTRIFAKSKDLPWYKEYMANRGD